MMSIIFKFCFSAQDLLLPLPYFYMGPFRHTILNIFQFHFVVFFFVLRSLFTCKTFIHQRKKIKTYDPSYTIHRKRKQVRKPIYS